MLAFKRGLIHFGILAFVIIVMSLAASIGILAQPNNPQRVFNRETIAKTLCDKSRNSIWCIYSRPTPKPSNDTAILPQGPCYPGGDVNGDKAIDEKDSQAILNYVSRIGSADPPSLAVADVDSDGQISSKDAVLIRQYLAGALTKFPACFQNESSSN